MESDVELHRQVHPKFVEANRPTHMVFTTFKKQNRSISVVHGGIVGAAQAFENHSKRGSPTVGTLTVLVAECHQSKLRAEHDRLNFEEHASISCGMDVSGGEAERRFKALFAHAWQRGWQHGPVQPRCDVAKNDGEKSD